MPPHQSNVFTKAFHKFIRRFTSWQRMVAQEDSNALFAKMASFGPGCGIYGRAHITAPHKINIGSNVHIGDNAFIKADGGLTIGDNTHISRNLLLYTVNHRYEGDRLPYDDSNLERPVYIGRNVWIGMNVCIAPGTRIGDGAIVAMGTVVSGEVPIGAIIGSSKWRIIGNRDPGHYSTLDNRKAYGGPNGVPFCK